jgi:membrane-bound lytic murein transglycosylase D
MFTKGKKYLPKAAVILQKQKLPEEFKVLLTLESAYNGNAVSNAGAVGYWQIMDEVAKEYGMKYVPQIKPSEKKKWKKEKAARGFLKSIDRLRDDRKNFIKSSQVAARYLRDRRVNLNDNWLLVVASYNCGVGNVWAAMEKSGKANPTFWDIKNMLPAETRAYVMNFITLNVLFHNYENFVKRTLLFYPEKSLINDNFEQNADESVQESLKELK